MSGMISKSIGGEKTTQFQEGNQRQSTEFRPQDLTNLQQAQQGLIGQTQGFQGLTSQLQQQAAQQGAPQLQTQFNQAAGLQAFQPGQLDALGRQQVSQGTQALNQQAATQQRALAQQFGGQPGIAQALGQQTAMRARLQANPLLMQAGEQSAARGFQTAAGQQQLAQLQAQQQQAANQAQLQQQQAGQSARQEQAGLAGTGLQSQQQLLPLLSQLAGQMGTQVSQSDQAQRSRVGGFVQNAGGNKG